MLKRSGLFILVCTTLTLLILSSFKEKPVQKPVLRTIVLDAGHGGYDVGAEGE